MRILLFFLSLISFGPSHAALPKVILFDILGTCVDVRGSLTEQGIAFGRKVGIDKGNWRGFANAWIYDHASTIRQINEGKLPWMNVDEIHRRNLENLLREYFGPQFTKFGGHTLEVSHFWSRLEPWGDVVKGLHLLRKRFTLGAFSNVNASLLNKMSENVGLPWNHLISADQVKHYKPEPEFYQYAEKILGLSPGDILLVAAHQYDLDAAKKLGWKTAYVPRNERTENRVSYDYLASDFVDLNRQLQ